mgnify:CR=1 FL=1
MAYNVFSLCVRAGLDAQSCQLAPMPNRSTTIELTTSDADLLRATIHELREAALEHHWDDYTFDFAHGQMYTGTVRGNRELERVWAEEVSPARGRTPITSVRLPVDIEARLDARAVTEDAKPAEIIRRALVEYFDRHPA